MGDSADTSWVLVALTAHEGPLLRFAATLVGTDAARDIVQDTFLELCRAKRETVEDHLVPWLFTVCKNRALSLRRSQRRHSEVEEIAVMESTEVGPDTALEHKQAGESVATLLDELSTRDREVVALKFAGGLSYKEIAEVTGLSVSHVGVILHESLKKVRQKVAASADVETRRAP